MSKIKVKGKDFNFGILGFPSFTTNIRNKITYGVFCTQFYRFASVGNFIVDFIFNCKLFIKLSFNNMVFL